MFKTETVKKKKKISTIWTFLAYHSIDDMCVLIQMDLACSYYIVYHAHNYPNVCLSVLGFKYTNVVKI